jgi:hypothetical protein
MTGSNELGRIWKEAVVARLRSYSPVLLKELGKMGSNKNFR